MTKQESIAKKLKIYDAWNAGFIDVSKCQELVKEIERAYYVATHGEFKLSELS